MVRGYQKRIIHLKSTESELFDEAFFLVNEKTTEGMNEKELIREANRIVDESLRDKEKRHKKIKENMIRVLCCILGAALGSFIYFLLTII